VALIVSRYNASVTERLEAGARAAYRDRIGPDHAVETIHAPGAFELPQLAAAAARAERFDAIVALGCLVRGETPHDRHIARAVAHGLTDVSVRFGLPVAFGVLTVETPEQAVARAGGAKGNKGSEAMLSALGALEAMRGLEGSGSRGPGRRADLGGTGAPDKVAGWAR
jgi:6,7-dimethyl-8-ribityllumazine synthase